MTTAAPASLLVPGAAAPGAGALNLDNVSRDDLKEMCRSMYSDLTFLADYVPAKVGSAISTALTFGAALGAGCLDGYLGAKNNIGPIGITTAITGAAAIGAILSPHSDVREGLAAVARGVGAPLLYNWSKDKTSDWKASKSAKMAAA